MSPLPVFDFVGVVVVMLFAEDGEQIAVVGEFCGEVGVDFVFGGHFLGWLVSGFIASDTQRVTYCYTESTFICNRFSHAAKEPEQGADGQSALAFGLSNSSSGVWSLLIFQCWLVIRRRMPSLVRC